MKMIEMFLKELEQETQITRKMFKCIPADKFDWRPHPKSMSIGELTTHIADLPRWVWLAIFTDELDFAKNPYNPAPLNTVTELLQTLDENLKSAKESLDATDEDALDEMWTMRNGDHIILVRTRAELIRVALNQTTHHRAQLGVFLRLLNIPIPGSYGPSADELQLAAAEQE